MNTPRSGHAAALITGGPLSGMVLAAGGSSVCRGCTPILASAELYDPSTGLWSDTGSMTIARYWDNASPAVLPDGSILVVGGTTCCPYSWFNKAETYDPASQTWTPTSTKMTNANERVILLPDGNVLVAGGVKGSAPTAVNVADVELFDSSAGTWTATASMSTDRAQHTLTLLSSRQVLVAGGGSGGWGICNDLTSAELYDSSAGTWFPTGNMTAARSGFSATLLPNGQVLAAGGNNCEGNVLSSAELYTPTDVGPLELTSAASRKTHSSKGTFDIDLPLTGHVGIECRTGLKRYTVVFTFNNEVTGADRASSSCGTVSSITVDPANAHNLLVSFNGAACNAQTVTVTLTNVHDSLGNTLGSASASMGILVGDVLGVGHVGDGDIGNVQAHRGEMTNSTNFRDDVTVDGRINNQDVQTVRSYRGSFLP